MAKLSQKVIEALFDLQQNGWKGFVVSSSSMLPALKPGDTVTMRDPVPGCISAGDVVVYRDKEEFKIVHRITKIFGRVVTTAGDAVDSYDDPVDISDIIGIVNEVPRKRPPSKIFRFFRMIMRRFFPPAIFLWYRNIYKSVNNGGRHGKRT